MANQEIW